MRTYAAGEQVAADFTAFGAFGGDGTLCAMGDDGLVLDWEDGGCGQRDQTQGEALGESAYCGMLGLSMLGCERLTNGHDWFRY